MGNMLWQAPQDVSLVSASVENWAVGRICAVCSRSWQFIRVCPVVCTGRGSEGSQGPVQIAPFLKSGVIL